jgi:hypothetical protein
MRQLACFADELDEMVGPANASGADWHHLADPMSRLPTPMVTPAPTVAALKSRTNVNHDSPIAVALRRALTGTTPANSPARSTPSRSTLEDQSTKGDRAHDDGHIGQRSGLLERRERQHVATVEGKSREEEERNGEQTSVSGDRTSPARGDQGNREKRECGVAAEGPNESRSPTSDIGPSAHSTAAAPALTTTAAATTRVGLRASPEEVPRALMRSGRSRR